MAPALQALLTGIVDYAGLFPPASLPLPQALENYARYRASPEGWMLGRFLCPAARLAEVTPFMKKRFASGPPLAISALGQGQTQSEFLGALPGDVQAIGAFINQHAGRAVVDALEVKLPAEVVRVQHLEAVVGLLGYVTEIIEKHGPPGLMTYCETSFTAGGRSAVGMVITALHAQNEVNAARRPASRRIGFKLRCGGLEALAFPSPEQVAYTIPACRDGAVPLKFTAGLHEPIRHADPSLKTHVHGFLNVFTAGVLAHARGLDEEQVRQIVEDESAGNFVLDERGLRWQEVAASTEEVAAARQQGVVSFGSCSFDEPRDGLRRLGLLT